MKKSISNKWFEESKMFNAVFTEKLSAWEMSKIRGGDEMSPPVIPIQK